mgnify:CR=1 FL=1
MRQLGQAHTTELSYVKTASTTPFLHLKHFGAGRVSDVLSEA